MASLTLPGVEFTPNEGTARLDTDVRVSFRYDLPILDELFAKRAALPRECGRIGFSGTTAAAWARAYGCDRRVAACQQLVGPRAKFIVIRELDGMGGVGRAARAKLAE